MGTFNLHFKCQRQPMAVRKWTISGLIKRKLPIQLGTQLYLILITACKEIQEGLIYIFKHLQMNISQSTQGIIKSQRATAKSKPNKETKEKLSVPFDNQGKEKLGAYATSDLLKNEMNKPKYKNLRICSKKLL